MTQKSRLPLAERLYYVFMEGFPLDRSNMLEEIAELSHEFGVDAYLKGGGGNSSAKDEKTLWIKPSGSVLRTIRPDTFLPMLRDEMAKAYGMAPPRDVHAREAMIKDAMLAAVRPDATGRASVEAPLHDSLDAVYVMHTHPVLVNGMTCAKQGAEVCRDVFPDHVWVDYVDPGYTLCMVLRGKIQDFKARHGVQPEAIFLKNHGLFVGADTATRLREIHHEIMQTLEAAYAKAGIDAELVKGTSASDAEVGDTVATIKALLKADAAYVCCSDPFDIATGPISPDHIVYHKAHPYVGDLTAEPIAAFTKQHGYSPRIIKTDAGVFSASSDASSAELALELAVDGAQIRQLAEAFGGIEYMTPAAAEFIDNWEVEAYRRKQVGA